MSEATPFDSWAEWTVCGLGLARTRDGTLDGLAEHGDWLAEVVDERGALPPPGMIIDIGRLLTAQRREPGQLPGGSLGTALRLYQDQLLGRIEMSPVFNAVVDALAPLDHARQTRALAVVIGRVLDRIGFSPTAPIRPALLRDLARAPTADLAELADDEAAMARLERDYERIGSGARRAPRLLYDTDRFLVEHIDALGDLGQRLAVEQMSSVATELARELPQRLKARRRDPDRLPTQLNQDDLYPVGGFASLSTSGSFENLVSSELVYMDNDSELDLFDLRYAESELLYYARDDSLYRRGHRSLHIAFDDVAAARVKDPGARWQRLVTACGVLAAVVQRLARWLESEALRVRFSFVTAEGTEPVDEHALIRILLSELVERGVVDVDTPASLTEIRDRARDDGTRGEAALVIVSARPVELPGDDTVLVRGLDLSAARPWSQWRQIALELLQELV